MDNFLKSSELKFSVFADCWLRPKWNVGCIWNCAHRRLFDRGDEKFAVFSISRATRLSLGDCKVQMDRKEIYVGARTGGRRSILSIWNKSPLLVSSCSHTLLLFVISGSAAQRGLWPPRLRGFLITHNDAPQSVGLLWASDQPVAKTSTWKHTTHTTDKHPCLRWDSNPRSLQASGRRPTP
jgi:hypothetical protein